MVHLTLAGVSDDGRRLVLVSDAGVEFTLDLDNRLRAALRGETARLGQLEIQMTSALRPRDIQARIRSGESPEAVAQAAQTTVDKIMAYAGPVLAEREHVALRAQRSTVRRRAGEAAGSVRTLGDTVAAHLRTHNVDPGSIEWDAWRREDGRWAVVGVFASIKRQGTAQFTFDAPGNFVVVDNDDATWLIGDEPAARPETPDRDDLRSARARRLSSVPGEDGPDTLGDDALELVHEPTSEPQAETLDLGADLGSDLGGDMPLEAFFDDEPATDEKVVATERELADEAADAAALDQDPPAAPAGHVPADDEPSARRPTKKRGRASVPSWDEIMFGGGKQD